MEYKKFIYSFANKFYNIYNKHNFSDIVFICIGTNKVIGDSFGPRVGEQLEKYVENNKLEKIHICGTMQNTVNYMNAQNYLQKIQNKYERPCIIIIDAALGDETHIGNIIVNNGGIQIGEALEKDCYCKAFINIKGVVGKNQQDEKTNMKLLRQVKKEFIVELANMTSYGINKIIEQVKV